MAVVNKGDFVVDYATPKDLGTIKAAGYKGVARYICGSPTVWKVITPRERDQIVAAGLGLWLIWETSANAAVKGAAQGRLDGAAARRDADRLGYNGTIVIATTDFDVTAATLAAVLAYCHAFKAACGLPCGIYADTDIAAAVRPGEFVPIWRPSASWWSRVFAFGVWNNRFVHPNTDIRQMTGRVPGTDHGEVLKDGIPMWKGTPVAPVLPVVGIPRPTLQLTLTSRFVKNAEVLHLQQACNFWGWRDALGRKLAEDGRFGEQTKQGVRSMQKALRRTQDGVYGPATANSYKEFLAYMHSLAGH